MIRKLARLSFVVFLAITTLAAGVGASPASAHSLGSTSQNLLAAGAPATMNISEVMLNVRANSSVRTTELVRVLDPNNPVGFDYKGIFIFGIPAVKITETIGAGNDAQGLDIGGSTYIGLTNAEWYGIGDDVQLVGKSGQDRDDANRIFEAAGAFPFEAIPSGNIAKLSKADQTEDSLSCDEYAWKNAKNAYIMCVTRDTALPVVLKATLDTISIEVHYSDYNNPENIFTLPRDQTDTYYVADAYMALVGLKNFEYKTVYGTKTSKGVSIDSTVQGLFVQENAAFQASDWLKTDDTSTAAADRYLQIGRLRWTAPGDTSKPFKTSPLLNPKALIQFSDKFTRATPFLIWMSIVSDPQFQNAAQVIDDQADFNGDPAVKYRFGAGKSKPDDFVEMLVVTKTGVPVHVDYHFTEGSQKSVITWDLTSMDEDGKSIDAPAPTKK